MLENGEFNHLIIILLTLVTAIHIRLIPYVPFAAGEFVVGGDGDTGGTSGGDSTVIAVGS